MPTFKSEMLQEKLPLPRDAGAPSQVTAESPERASEVVPERATLAVENVAPSAGEVTVNRGRVLSIFTVALAVAVFPAASVTVPLTT
jgi:hypothetical protein